MKVKKQLLAGVLSLSVIIGSSTFALAQSTTYKVQQGDSFYSISQRYGISTSSLMQANNATSSTILYTGQNLIVPITDGWLTHTVVSGDTYWTISNKYGVALNSLMTANNATASTVLNIGNKVAVPLGPVYFVQQGDTLYIISKIFNVTLSSLLSYNGLNESSTLYIRQRIRIPQPNVVTPTPTPNTQPYVTYTSYTIKSGDNLWNLAISFGIPDTELMSANNLTASSMLTIGQVIKVPVHHVPVMATPGAGYGENLDWWTQAQYVIPTNAVFQVVDFYTGKTFNAKRTTGASHADCEPMTTTDTQKMKEIWGGTLSWKSRPILIKYNGRTIAASCASYPHAGNDAAAGGVYTTWRSGDYGPGPNFDWVKGNGMDGHFDIHFKNSITHNTGLTDPYHQSNVKIAAGVK